MNEKLKIAALDLDGTLTQHKTPLDPQNRHALDLLAQQYRLVILGAGDWRRIHRQLGGYPIDVIGGYGMQTALYDHEAGELILQEDHRVPVDRETLLQRAASLRQILGCTSFTGETLEFHSSGLLTFPSLGTAAALSDKLAYDPDRKKRRAMYPAVQEAFPEYRAFVGGSSSFDLAPQPFCKSYALKRYCSMLGLSAENAAFFGDDYGLGGNDEDVAKLAGRFIPVDDYRAFPQCAAQLL